MKSIRWIPELRRRQLLGETLDDFTGKHPWVLAIVLYVIFVGLYATLRGLFGLFYPEFVTFPPNPLYQYVWPLILALFIFPFYSTVDLRNDRAPLLAVSVLALFSHSPLVSFVVLLTC